MISDGRYKEDKKKWFLQIGWVTKKRLFGITDHNVSVVNNFQDIKLKLTKFNTLLYVRTKLSFRIKYKLVILRRSNLTNEVCL